MHETITARTSGVGPDGEAPEPAQRAPALAGRRLRPAHIALAIVGLGALASTVGPISDFDSYWHVRIGREILARHTLSGLGRSWLGVPAGDWQTSQWLSEVAMAQAVDRLGWWALTAGRFLLAVAVIAILGLTLVRRRQPVLAVLVAVPAVVGAVVGVMQERPASASLVFVALLGPVCERLWTQGRRPPLLAVGLASFCWAQVHGLWILAPAAFVLVAVGGVLEGPRRHRAQVSRALACAGASLAGCLNPEGLNSFLLPVRFQGAGSGVIGEWLPTTVTTGTAMALGVLVAATTLAWARTTGRVRGTELLWVGSWVLFAALAFRNVAPALLMIAPVTLTAMERAWGARADQWNRPPGRREARLLAAVLAAVVVTGCARMGVAAGRTDPLASAPALGIARHLAATGRALRVFNAYNTSGSLIAFGGGKLQLVVDGRADLWGNAYIHRVIDAEDLSPGWDVTFNGFHPDAAVLGEDVPLVALLTREGSWVVTMTDGGWVLLEPAHH